MDTTNQRTGEPPTATTRGAGALGVSLGQPKAFVKPPIASQTETDSGRKAALILVEKPLRLRHNCCFIRVRNVICLGETIGEGEDFL